MPSTTDIRPDQAGNRTGALRFMCRRVRLWSGPPLCALIGWVMLGLLPGDEPTCGATVVSAVVQEDEKKSDDKKNDEKNKDKEKEQAEEKEKGGKEDKKKEDAKSDDKKSKSGDKAKDKNDKNKDSAKKKDEKKSSGGGLTEEQLEEMKRILMDKMRERTKPNQDKPGKSPKPEAKKKPESQPAGEKEPPTSTAPARTGPPATQPQPGEKTKEGGAPEEPEAEPKPVRKPPRSTIRSRDRSARAPRKLEPRRVSPDRPETPRGQNAKDQPSIIMPVELPEGVEHPWEAPEDWRPYFFSFEKVNPKDLLQDWSRMAGLSLIGIGKAKGQPITYHSLGHMNYWEAFTVINELLEPNNVFLVQDRQHFRVIAAGDLRQWIRPEHIYRTREGFESAGVHDPIPVKVFFTPPQNVAPNQVAQWINDLPDSLRLGSATQGNMHVSGFSKDIRKLFYLVDILDKQRVYDPRETRWIPVDKVDVNEVADLVRRFIDTKVKAAPARSRKKGPGQIEPLEDYAEVDVLAVPKVKMLFVKGKLSTVERIEELVREIVARAPDEQEREPVIIPLQHAKADDIIPLLESVLTGAPVSREGKRGTKPSSRRPGGAAAARADTIDLSGTREEIQIMPEPNTNALIVIASEEGVARVRKLLEIFDVQGSAPTFVRITLQHARVEAVQQVLNAVMAPDAKRGKGSKDLLIVPEPSSNTLFLAGKEDAIHRAREVVEEMDVSTAGANTHLVTLANQTPSLMAQLMTQMEAGGERPRKGGEAGGVKFIGDDPTKTLIVVCPDARWGDIKDLIERLDNAAASVQSTRTFKIEAGDVQQVANLLKEMFGGRGPRTRTKTKGRSSDVSISVDVLGSQIFVRAEEKVIGEIARVIEEMESAVEKRDTVQQTFRLVSSTPTEMIKVLTTFYPPSAPVGQHRIIPSDAQFAPVGKSIVVRATPDKMDQIAELIAQLDAKEQESTQIVSFEVKDADPQQVTRALEDMFRTRGRGKRAAAEGPTFTAAGKKIIVVAEPELFPRIEEVIRQFEGEVLGLVYRQFVAQYAEVGEIASLMEGLLQARASETGGVAPVGKGRRVPARGTVVKVTADPRTKTLFVVAPGEIMAYAEELMQTLDSPQPEDVEEIIVRTVQLEQSEVEDMVQALQRMMSGGADVAAKKATKRTGPRSFHARLAGKMKGQVSMVPAPGANAVILRGIASDVDAVEALILAIDQASLSQKKIARRYYVTDMGMGVEEFADTVMAVAGGGKTGAKSTAEDEFAIGPRVGKDMIITTDWYTDSMVVVATPEKHTEVELLIEALSTSAEGPEGIESRYPIRMIEITHGDPYQIMQSIEDVLDELLGRKNRTKLMIPEGSDSIAISGPSEQTDQIVQLIRDLDIPGIEPRPAFQIRSLKSPVPLDRVIEIVRQQLPGVELEIQDTSLVPVGLIEEVSAIEEVTPTYGPATLAHISAELHRLLLTSGDQSDDENRKEPVAGAEEPSGAGSQPDVQPIPRVRLSIDSKTGTIRLQGNPKDVEAVNDVIDAVLEELKKLPYRPDIRVFRIKHANVTEVARVMESVLGAQSGGAASRQQQLLQQRLKQQQLQLQMQRQKQAQAQMRKMLGQQPSDEEKEEPKEEEKPKEREDEAEEFGTTRIRVYPDTRTSTIIVRAATEDYPVILELLAKIDKPAPSLTEFKIFKLVKLNASDVETAIKAILRLDRQPSRAQPRRPGQRPGQPQQGGQPQMIAQLQQQLSQMQQTAGQAEGVSINWAEQVTITSDGATNTILAAGPKTAIDYIEKMIEDLEGQDIHKEIVKTIQLSYTRVDEIVPALTEIFSSKGAAASGPSKLRSPRGGAGRQEAVQTAFSQVVITGDSRTNSLIVKALEEDMTEVENLIAKLDVDAGEEGKVELHSLAYADASAVSTALSEMFITGDRSKSKLRIVADAGTNSILIRGAPPHLRDEIVSQMRALDTQKGLDSAPRTIPILAGNAESIAEKLNRVFGGRGRAGGEVNILGDNSAKRLVIIAPDAVYEQIETLVQVMDKPASEANIQIYELEHAAAPDVLTQMQDLISQMIRNRAMTGAGKDVELDAYGAVADPRTNSIIVMGAPGVQALVGQVLRQIDVAPAEASQIATMIFPLTLSNVNEVAKQVRDLFSGRRDTGVEPPVVSPNTDTNTLLVLGTRKQLDEVRSFIAQLEKIIPRGRGELKDYTLRIVHAKADDVAQTLNEYFTKRFNAMRQADVKGVKPTDMQVSVTPDINSNQIFVVASEANKEEIDRLLSTIDVEGAEAATTLVTKIFPLTFADPNQTANAVNQAFRTQGRVAERERVNAVVEYGTRSVIVTANAENMQKVDALLEQLDSETGSRQTFAYQVTEARVVDLVNVLRDFVNQSKSRTGRGQLPITLVANEATNTMLVSATQQEYDQLLPTIELLDRPPEAETGRYAKAYKLNYSDPGSVNHIITNAFQQRGRLRPEDVVTSAVDWGTSTLIVVANEENHRKITDLLADMDKADVKGMQVRQIEIRHAGAQEVAQALTQTFIHGQRQRRGESSISITGLVGTNVILVRSDQRTFDEIKQVVAEMDTPDSLGAHDVRVVTLENVDVDEAKTILENYLRKRGGRGGELVGDVRVSASPTTNALVIAGPAEQLDRLVKMIHEFDLDPAVGAGLPQVIQLVHGDAVQIAETLTRMFGQKQRGRGAHEPPVIEAVAGSNALIVKGRKPDLNMIRGVVETLDTEELAGAAGNVEIIQVAQGINIDDLAGEIERVINEAERQAKRGQKGAQANEISIGVDRRTNTMLVAGTTSQVKQVRELVSFLEQTKPVGPTKILIRRPVNLSGVQIKAVLDQLIEEKTPTSSRGRSGRTTRPKRPPPRRPRR